MPPTPQARTQTTSAAASIALSLTGAAAATCGVVLLSRDRWDAALFAMVCCGLAGGLAVGALRASGKSGLARSIALAALAYIVLAVAWHAVAFLSIA